MNLPNPRTNDFKDGAVAMNTICFAASDSISTAEATLRLIATLPAPDGLAERVQFRLDAEPRTAQVLSWPAALVRARLDARQCDAHRGGRGDCFCGCRWGMGCLLTVQSFAKTSGSKGLQIYVPLNSAVTHDDEILCPPAGPAAGAPASATVSPT